MTRPRVDGRVAARRVRALAVLALALAVSGPLLAPGVAVAAPASVAPASVAPASVAPASAASFPRVPTQAGSPSPGPYADDPNDAVRRAEYWIDSLGIRQAWNTTRGAGQRIAVLDTGVANGPAELSGAVVAGMDASGTGSVDGRTPIGSSDDSSHGTLVGSIAAARGTGSGTGMIGVAPEAELLSVSLGFGPDAPISFDQQVADGIRWAVDNGATVINLSFTTNDLTWPQSWDSAFSYAFEHNVVVVVAAGNRGSGTTRVGAPATIPGVLAVAGVTPEGVASQEASTQGIVIGVSAPSEQLVGITPDGSAVRWNGTSGAAPIVAGIAALVRAANPGISADNVIERIIRTATAPPGIGVPDALYGYGIVNAAQAISAQVSPVTANPLGDLAEWIRIYRRANATPAPVPSATLAPVGALPAPDSPTARRSALLPSSESILTASIPLLALSAAGSLVALGVTAAVRRISKARNRTPSP